MNDSKIEAINMVIKGHPMQKWILSSVLVTALLLPAWAANAQCPGPTVFDLTIPRGTPSIHVDWFAPVTYGEPATENGFIDFPQFMLIQRRYVWDASVPVILQLSAANGPVLFSHIGTANLHPCPCNGDPGVGGSEDIDVSTLTAAADLQVTETMQACLNFSFETWNTSVNPPVLLFPSESSSESLPLAIGFTFNNPTPPRFFFDLDPAQVVATPNPWNTPPIARVLTHKYGSDDAYPSAYQIDRQDVTLRPRFRFTGTAKANGSGAALNVWFRVIDPPDTAPYVVVANDAHDNDNKDPFSGGKGILMTSGCTDFSSQSTCAAMNGNALATTTAADGTIEVVLETSTASPATTTRSWPASPHRARTESSPAKSRARSHATRAHRSRRGNGFTRSNTRCAAEDRSWQKMRNRATPTSSSRISACFIQGTTWSSCILTEGALGL